MKNIVKEKLLGKLQEASNTFGHPLLKGLSQEEHGAVKDHYNADENNSLDDMNQHKNKLLASAYNKIWKNHYDSSDSYEIARRHGGMDDAHEKHVKYIDDELSKSL